MVISTFIQTRVRSLEIIAILSEKTDLLKNRTVDKNKKRDVIIIIISFLWSTDQLICSISQKNKFLNINLHTFIRE